MTPGRHEGPHAGPGAGPGAPTRILAVCGSLQAASANRDLLETAARLAPPGVTVTSFDGLRDLPLFNPDIEAGASAGPGAPGAPGAAYTPPAVSAWRAALAGCDAVLIASPEYGHSLPGALKNGIDWVIGSGELERKVVAITAATRAPERGRKGLLALAGTLQAVSARIVGGEPIVQGPGFEAAIRALVDALVAEVAREEG